MFIEVKNITKRFGRHGVLNNACFSADYAECVGIIGANGCGKSTLFSILAGIQKGSGEFWVEKDNLLKKPSLCRQKIAYIPQGTPLIDELTAYDNLLLWYTKQQISDNISSGGIIKQLGVDEFLNKAVRKMSGGMKKRLSIACAVANNPQVVIMDEPTAALDIVCKRTVAEYIKSLKKQGKTVIISTHEYSELKMCDRLYLLKNGSLTPYTFNGDINALAEIIE